MRSNKVKSFMLCMCCIVSVAFFQGCKKDKDDSPPPPTTGGGGPAPQPAPDPYSLKVSMTGDGSGKVTSNPTGIDCGSDCKETFLPNQSVTLTPSPKNSFSQFKGWSGDCSGKDNCKLTMSKAKNVTAQFDLVSFDLGVSVDGDGVGKVVSTNGIDCGTDCSEPIKANTEVTLVAQPADSFTVFAGWTGDCSGNGDCVVTMDQSHNVGATFNKASLNGSYTGTTSQGYSIAVNVEQEGIKSYSYKIEVDGIYCDATIEGSVSTTQPEPIDENHSFEWNVSGDILAGTFQDPLNMSGTLHVISDSCRGSATVSWDATRAISVASTYAGSSIPEGVFKRNVDVRYK